MIDSLSVPLKLRSEGSQEWLCRELRVAVEKAILGREKSRAKAPRHESTSIFQELIEDQCGQSSLENGLEETRLP